MLGLLALGSAFYHHVAGPIDPAPPIEEVIADKVVKIREAVISGIKGVKYESEVGYGSWNKDRILYGAIMVIGFSAIVLGMLGFIRREDRVLSGSAAVLGGAAIAFQFLALALVQLFWQF